jgi:outer membrane receptor protein involved in Fe transport
VFDLGIFGDRPGNRFQSPEPEPVVSIDGGLKSEGDVPRIDPDGTAGYGTLNARVAWAATPALDLALRLENLADKRYRDHGSGLDDPGRNLIATLDWRF